MVQTLTMTHGNLGTDAYPGCLPSSMSINANKE
jgi:hypothetical protein